MKSTTKTMLAALLLFALSCKKDNTAIPSIVSNDESTTQAVVTDINDPAANAVQIGTQVWRTKNLDVTRYRNGDPIPYVKSKAKWAALTTGAWCWYRNDSTKGAVYGKLYNWAAVNDPRGLAPAGWHIPSDEEWTTLTTYLGGESVAGGKMKSTGTIEAGTGLWYAPNGEATNSSGFTAFPGGYRNNFGRFNDIGYYGYWWSSTEFNSFNAWYRYLNYYNGYVFRSYYEKRDGFFVRCIRD